MQIFLCHYVPKGSDSDLLWGYDWREALLPIHGIENIRELRELDVDLVERHLIDRETGKLTGEVRNYCVDPLCQHEDCGPCYLLIKTSN